MAQNVNINPGASYQDPKRQGSGFTNLSRILQANQNNRLGSTISQGLSSGAQGVKNQLGQEVGQFQQASNAAQLGNPQELAQKQAALQQIANGSGSPSQNDIDLFAKLRGGNYSGPTGLDASKVAGLTNRASNLEGIGQGLSAGGDKTQALRAYVSQNPAYSAGEQKLDTLLLGAPEQKSQLASARRAGVGLSGQVGKEANVAQQIGQLRQNQATNVANQTKSELGLDTSGNVNLTGKGLIPELYQGLESKASQANAAQTARQQADLAALQGRQATGDLAGLKGLATYGVDPSQYLSLGQQADRSSVASAQDRAKFDALSKLAGVDQTFVDPNAQAYNPDNSVNFDVNAFKSATQNAAAPYNNALQQQISNDQLQQLGYNPSTFGGFQGQSTNNILNKYLAPGGDVYDSVKYVEDAAAQAGMDPQQFLQTHPGFADAEQYNTGKQFQQRAQSVLSGIQNQYGASDIFK